MILRNPIIITLLAVLVHSIGHAQSKYQAERDRMVRIQIGGTLFGRTPVKDEAVLEAMRKVPRHEFVPSRLVRAAYTDSPLPIGEGQTISQPYIVGFMTEALKPSPTDTILEIGTGSGYQAAVLAEIVEKVYTIEIVEPLGKRAKAVLDKLKYKNVTTKIGDGYIGWKEHAPFDGIIVTAAPDHIPKPLIEQLKIGGRLVIPVGPEGRTQKLLVLTKQADGTTKKKELMLVRFVPFTGQAQEKKN
jgi:protein-L-isoaspartate(D-aspartate) O-methyltransferase